MGELKAERKAVYMSLRDKLEFYQLSMTADEKGNPLMTVMKDTNTLIDLEDKTHDRYFSEVYLGSRQTENGPVPVLVRQGYGAYGRTIRHKDLKQIEMTELIGNPDYEKYVKRSAKSFLKMIVNDKQQMLFMCKEDVGVAATFELKARELISKL